MKQQLIRVGGVPEHFNLPWHLGIENGDFERRGLRVEWITFKGGTGEMTRALRQGEVDVCILLTEGIITDIINGNPSKIISEYVITPLTWGVHTATNNSLESYDDIFDKKFAISRFRSGSHLMPIVDANGKGKEIRKDQFVIIKNLEGALTSLANNETDVFYWEKYTTKPYVDSGQLCRLGEYLTPWPCFMIAATNDILENQPENIIRLLRTIHDVCDEFMRGDQAVSLVSSRYNLQIKDVERWFHSTEWAIHGWVSNKMIQSVIYYLRNAEIIKPDQDVPELIWKR